MTARTQGPLAGLRVVELNALAAVPFCGQLLSDLGADVLRIDRPTPRRGPAPTVDVERICARGRRSVAVDLKHPAGVDTVLRLVDNAAVLIEGFRPGVAERLGIGPDVCIARNPRLVYGRGNGWGHDGPFRARAGHDINYLAIAGVLSMLGPSDRPPMPPQALVGDFGGGVFLAFGVLCAVYRVERSGQGQVVDAPIMDAALTVTGPYHEMLAMGARSDERGTGPNEGAPFYRTYEAADGRYIAVGAVEPEFYAELLDVLGFRAEELPDQLDRSLWPEVEELFAHRIRTKTREEWCALADDRDACLSPVLTLAEVARYPHHVARGAFIDVGGVLEPAPRPIFSRTPNGQPPPPAEWAGDTIAALVDWGFPPADVDRLIDLGAVRAGGQRESAASAHESGA